MVRKFRANLIFVSCQQGNIPSVYFQHKSDHSQCLPKLCPMSLHSLPLLTLGAFPCPNSRPSPAPDLLSLAVVQSLASYGGPVVDCCWDTASSAWSPWTPAPPVEEGADAHVRPTLEISRLQWFFQRVMKV